MKIIDGKKIANEILEDLKYKIDKKSIGLAVILVGKNPASEIYVKMKKKACEKIGIKSHILKLNETIKEIDLLDKIEQLNEKKNIHGILVQMPLPKHLKEENIINKIDPKKDVDGFHPLNIGKMFLGNMDVLMPCTPWGIKILLEKSNIEIIGKHVVIVGRSNIVGKPLAAILMQKQKGCNATVTVLHSKSENFEEITRSADILIAAIGKPNFIKKEMIKKDVIIIDVGINRINNKIVGDVDFNDVFEKVSKITPVPGGAGPMTIATLLLNTYKSFLKNQL